MLGSLTTRRMVLVVALALIAGLVSIAVLWKPASAAVPTGFQDSLFTSGLEQATAMEFAPDGRLFVTEKDTGKIRVIDQDGNLQQTAFVTIPNIDDRQTRGLIGITLHPNFGDGTNDYVYAHYTHREGENSNNRIVRFTATIQTNTGGDPIIDPGTGEPTVVAAEQNGIGSPIFELDRLGTSTTHDGGHIEFGNDGKLYIPVGDNKRNKEGPLLNTLKLSNLFGKVLRLNPDLTIPTDNPFYSKTSGNNRAIYARGFRNPFTMAVEPDPAVEPASLNRIYINDVGERTWEEINKLQAGGNYGWPKYEGREGDRRFKKPVFAYKHDTLPRTSPATSGCAISGGVFYYAPAGATAAFPAEYEGDYFFTDLCNGWIRNLEATGGKSGFASLNHANSPVDLKVGPDGGLYYLQYGGSVRVIRPTG